MKSGLHLTPQEPLACHRQPRTGLSPGDESYLSMKIHWEIGAQEFGWY